MEIKFVIDKEYDLQMVQHMLQGSDWEHRARRMGLNLDFAKTFHNSKEGEQPGLVTELGKLAEKEYTAAMPYMEKTRQQYQQSWNEIMTEFSRSVEELTYPWFYDTYTCVVTHFNLGISNWNGNVVGRWWKENPYTQRRITAHEILLAHYFSIHRHHFPNSELTDQQIWALAEIAAFALTGLEGKLKKFWPWDESGYYTNHNYPQIVRLQKQLKEPFLKRKNFQEYIEKGIELVKNAPITI